MQQIFLPGVCNMTAEELSRRSTYHWEWSTTSQTPRHLSCDSELWTKHKRTVFPMSLKLKLCSACWIQQSPFDIIRRQMSLSITCLMLKICRKKIETQMSLWFVPVDQFLWPTYANIHSFKCHFSPHESDSRIIPLSLRTTKVILQIVKESQVHRGIGHGLHLSWCRPFGSTGPKDGYDHVLRISRKQLFFSRLSMQIAKS